MSVLHPLACLEDFVGMTLLCLLALPNCFFKVYLPTLYRALETFPTNYNLCAISSAENPSNQHLRVLQLGRHINVKVELLFSQKLVQVHRILFHAVYIVGSGGQVFADRTEQVKKYKFGLELIKTVDSLQIKSL